jgi:hypothetical protein
MRGDAGRREFAPDSALEESGFELYYTSEGAHYVYNSVCREFAGSMLPRPDRNSHRTSTPIVHSRSCQTSVIKTT